MGSGRRGLLLGALCAAVVATAAPRVPQAGAGPWPAGTTSAVLSFVDAASGEVEVVRHWPVAPVDVAVRPMIPYFWDGCPGPGATMMLLIGPPGDGLAARTAAALGTVPAPDASAAAALAQIVADLRTPGDPAVEAIKAAAPLLGDLGTYERGGYAVFLFVRWVGVRCMVTIEAVPEGYGIPFVR